MDAALTARYEHNVRVVEVPRCDMPVLVLVAEVEIVPVQTVGYLRTDWLYVGSAIFIFKFPEH